MAEENLSQEYRLKNIEETRNYLIKEIGLYNSKLRWTLSYFSFCGYWMYFSFCFCFFTWYSSWITSFAIGFKICGITSAIKKKKKMKHDKIVLLAKTKWNRRKALIDS